MQPWRSGERRRMPKRNRRADTRRPGGKIGGFLPKAATGYCGNAR